MGQGIPDMCLFHRKNRSLDKDKEDTHVLPQKTASVVPWDLIQTQDGDKNIRLVFLFDIAFGLTSRPSGLPRWTESMLT